MRSRRRRIRRRKPLPYAEQGAQDEAITKRNACQSVHACASDEVEQNGLHIIVLMVSHTDGVGINIATQLFEIRISEVAGSHFDTE